MLMKRFYARFPLFFILWMALGLRLLNLGGQSLWYDEGVTWHLSQFSFPHLIAWTAADIQPPFYYGVIWLTTRLLGQSEFALRFPSAVFGLLAVPVLWQLARTFFPGTKRSHFLAAFFAAAAPLMVYYGQEARMYTLLVFQAALASWLIIRVVKEVNTKNRLQTTCYILLSASMLYTHYFSIFLLVAHGVYWLLSRRSLRLGATIFGSIALLFSPWVPVLLARLGDDPSYWAGALKLPEIVQDVFISFAVGGKREMIFEADGLRFAAGFGLILAACLMALLRKKTWRRQMTFLLLWLVLPVGLVILLSYQTPKFNPRYTMLAWPAFALILAGGLGAGWKDRISVGNAARLLAVGFIVFGWGFSLRNWFDLRSPYDQFSKDDFQALAQFVRERNTPGDTVLLSSGHFFPVWDYYAGADNRTPLPQMETLDVNRVTGFEVIPALETALAGARGVWLVTWQDEVIDPNGVVPLLLDTVGTRLDDEFHRANFIGVGLDYWRLPPKIDFPADFPAQIRTDYNFGNRVRLRGLTQLSDAEAVLFLQATRPLTEDDLVSIRLVDADGVGWGTETRVARPADYRYPASRWPVGEVIAGRQTLNWLPGTPPGDYALEIGWLTAAGEGIDVLDANGNPQRRTVTLGPLRVAQPVAAAVNAANAVDFGPVSLLSAEFETDNEPTVEAGSKVLLDSLWRPDSDSPAETIFLTAWLDSGGNRYPIDPPVAVTADVSAGEIFRLRKKISTPFAAEPGPVTLAAAALTDSSMGAPVAEVTLRSTDRQFSLPPQLDFQAAANFADLATLAGANIDGGTQISPGKPVNLTLYWRAENTFRTDYTIFVHLLGAGGTPVSNADHAPPRPTTNWIEGEIIADAVTLTIPADLPPGRYPLEVGLYNAADPAFARLPLVDAPADYLILTEIEVRSP